MIDLVDLTVHMEAWLDDTARKTLAIANDQEAAKLRIEGMEFAVREMKRYLNEAV